MKTGSPSILEEVCFFQFVKTGRVFLFKFWLIGVESRELLKYDRSDQVIHCER